MNRRKIILIPGSNFWALMAWFQLLDIQMDLRKWPFGIPNAATCKTEA